MLDAASRLGYCSSATEHSGLETVRMVSDSWWVMPAAVCVAVYVLSLIMLLLNTTSATVSSMQLEVEFEKSQNVFDLRLLAHVNQISVAITHGR